jgi:predicted amidohydrolase YtcJ
MTMPIADLILHNATVITMDPSLPCASMVAIHNGRILAVSGKDELNTFKGDRTETIDCHGMKILPGFNDAHCHPVSFAESLLSIDLNRTSILSISDIIEQIKEASQTIPEGKWITVRGYNVFYLAEKRHPNRWDLDKATTTHPVKLIHRTGHAHVLNSLALNQANITRYTEEPPGSIIERHIETGEPNGVLHNMGGYLAQVTPSLSDNDMERAAKFASDHLVSLGITSVQDASVRNDIRRWELLQRLKTKEVFKPNVTMMSGLNLFNHCQKYGFPPQANNNQLRLGSVKIILHETTGELSPTQEELNEKVLQIHRAGHQVALHAVEENTVEAACNAIEYAVNKYPREDHRHRIEHCSVCTPEMVKRLAELKVTVVTQPSFIYYNGERYLNTVPDEQLGHLYPISRLIKAGITVAGSSDCPVIPPDPIAGLYAAVSRITETGKHLLYEERVTPVEALQMYTRNAAYVCFQETIKGTLSPGYTADLIVLTGNPLKLTPEELWKLRVALTVINGEIVWRKGL